MKICFQNIGKVCGVYPLEISCGKSETHEIFESEKFITKTSKPTLNIPSRNDPRNSKKNKNYLEYTLEEKFTKETNSFESCKIRIGYVHNLSNLNEIMNISDFNEDQKLSYLS